MSTKHKHREQRTRTVLCALALALICLAACGPTDPIAASHGLPTATTASQMLPTATFTANPSSTNSSGTPAATTSPAATTLPVATTAAVHPTATPHAAATATPLPAHPGWTTVLDDEFTGAGIPSHWGLYDGHYGSGPSNNCAAPSQDSAPGNGYLYLKMSYKTSGSCGAGWYEGGMMISDAYVHTAQAVTLRWRILPSAHPTIVRSHQIIPMLFPSNDQWYSAEDDLCEGGQLATCDTYLHDGTASNTDKQVYHTYTVDLTQWHTWRFEQAHGTLIVYLDNMTTPVWTMKQGTSVLPDTLRNVALQQECPASACPPASYAGETETIQIDWITIQTPNA